MKIWLVMAVALAGSVSAGTYSGGDGSAENPYQIATAENMNAIGARPNDWDNHFVLTADIDLSAYTGTQFNIIGTDYDNAFTGVFDGNGHTITNFTYTTTTTDCIGLFGYAGYRAVIKNLTLVAPNVNAAGESDYIGCLVGRLHGAISGCGVEGGSVTGYYFTGGLVGVNQQNGVITNSYVTGSVTGRTFTGGLAGYNYGGTVSNCYSTASASGDNDTGGLVGCNEYGTISDCYATGSVSGGGWKTGGLVGKNYGTISNCYATGSVTGTDYIGGLAGDDWHGTISDSFWDVETTGQSISDGGEGKTTAEMKTAGTFFAWAGCGSEGLWTIDEGNDYPRLAWEGRPGQPLQQLSDLLTGSGTAVDPYLIYTAEQLNLIGRFSCELDKHFRLASDIDLSGFSGTEFNIIGNSTIKFTGVFDGNDHTISNFTYTTTDSIRIGIFGWVDGANAAIKDLTLVTPDVNAAGYSGDVGCLVGCLRFGTITGCGVEGGSVSGDYYTGELVGYNYEGTISNCYAAGSVTGDEGTGGLVGHNSRGRISNCRAAGSVSGEGYYTGGLVGRNYKGTISNCYATGSVSGDYYTGGLTGRNYKGTISNCYVAGSVSGGNRTGGLVGWNKDGTISASFWDMETTGQSGSDGGEGKTATQMKTMSTFTEAGWDFSTPIWIIDEGNDYPRLWWEEEILYVPGHYPTIQAAIDAARDGDTVIVAPGTYTGDGNHDIDFKGKAITVHSENGPENCIIDCENSGRGVYFHSNETSDSVLRGFTIVNGYAGNGGGIACINSSPTIMNCHILSNYSTVTRHGGGGGLYSKKSHPAIICCVIANNTTKGFGGGIFNTQGSLKILNSILRNNYSEAGGGVYCQHGSLKVNGCTIVYNSCRYSGGGLFFFDGSSKIDNTILWGNRGSNNHQIYRAGYATSVSVSYCDVQGGYSGTGNINVAPLFIDEPNDDFHLLSSSPCIEAGDPNYIPEPNETDLDGRPRVIGSRIDMGAYEFNPFKVAFDVNDRTRIDRTIFVYDCNVILENVSRFAVKNVQLEMIEASENMKIIDGNVTFGDIEVGAGESISSIDTCSFEVDRSRTIEPAEIIWRSTCEIVETGQTAQQTFSSFVFLEPENIAGDLMGDGKVDFVDLMKLADRWLWTGQAGSIGEDIVKDGYVDFLDFALLADNWFEDVQ